jgi:hypothetical protein
VVLVNQATLPSVPCCVVVVVPSAACCIVPVGASGAGSSASTLMTLLTESGEDTPLESLSMSSVSGLNSSRDSSRGSGRAKGSGRPRAMAVDRRTSGKGFLTEVAPADRPHEARHLYSLFNMSRKPLVVGSAVTLCQCIILLLLKENREHLEVGNLCKAIIETRPPLWSSGQSSWLQIRRPGFDSRHYQKKK